MRRGKVRLSDGRQQEWVQAGGTQPANGSGRLEWLPPVDGTVVGTLLNFRGEFEALGDTLAESPYQAPQGAGAVSQAGQYTRWP